MALQSSGQIKMSELNIEFQLQETRRLSLKDASDGTASTINTANASSDRPDGAAPHAISEFYSYDHSASSVTDSDYYWLGDGVNDTLRFTNHSSTLFGSNDDFSYSGWFRVDETSNQMQWLGSFSEASPSGANQIFIQYNATSARMQLRFRKGGGGNFHQRFWSISSTNNYNVTGVNSNGWKSTNRGNVNSEGFVHLVFTRDNSNTASSGMNLYWNGTKLPESIQFNSRSLATFNIRSVAIGDAVGSSPNNANVFKGGIDQVSVYTKTLTQSEVTALYNSGTPMTCSDAGVTTNLLAEYRLENNTTNTSGTFPSLTNSGGTFTAY
jgi:hypothetical protein